MRSRVLNRNEMLGVVLACRPLLHRLEQFGQGLVLTDQEDYQLRTFGKVYEQIGTLPEAHQPTIWGELERSAGLRQGGIQVLTSKLRRQIIARDPEGAYAETNSPLGEALFMKTSRYNPHLN